MELNELRRESGATEWVFVALAISLTKVGSESGASGRISPWFQPTGFGIPLHYILFGILLAAVAPYVVAAPAYPLAHRLKQLGLWRILSVAWVVIALTIAVAIVRRVPELFADWRNLLIAAVTVIFAAKWLATQRWKQFVLADLAIAYGLLAIPQLINYAAGYGATVLGVRTTVFDGPTLYLASFSAITACWYALMADDLIGPRRTILLRLAGVASSLLVLLSFRRSFWIAWLVGFVFVTFVYVRLKRGGAIRILSAILGGGALILVAIVAMGAETVLARVQSFAPTDTGQYSATNADHINDIIDAWYVIQTEPILGLGIGVQYETNLISDWKEESFEVHNALLHVWLKFGIAGAITYLGFHVIMMQRAARNALVVPIGAFIAGELVATVVGTWPYGSFQMSVFHGLLLAILAVNTEPDTSQEVSTLAVPISSGASAKPY